MYSIFLHFYKIRHVYKVYSDSFSPLDGEGSFTKLRWFFSIYFQNNLFFFFFCNRTITILKEQQTKNQPPVHLSLSLFHSLFYSLSLPFLSLSLSLSLAASSQCLSAVLLERRGRLFKEGKQREEKKKMTENMQRKKKINHSKKQSF